MWGRKEEPTQTHARKSVRHKWSFRPSMVQIALKQTESDDAVAAASSGNNLMWARYHSTFSCFIPPCSVFFCCCCFFANFTIPHSPLPFFTYLFWSQSEYSSPFGFTDCTAPLTICRSAVVWRKCQNVLLSVAQRPKLFNHITLSSQNVLYLNVTISWFTGAHFLMS